MINMENEGNINWNVKFDNLIKVYYTGSSITGLVKISFNNKEKVRSIRVSIIGFGYFKCGAESADVGFETYIDKKKYLRGNESAGTITIYPGDYEYPFKFNLPNDLPSSMEFDHGYIRYNLCFTVDIPNDKLNSSEHEFTVIKQLDLNNDPLLKEPKSVAKKSTFFSALNCIESDPLDIKVSIPVNGYAPGEKIEVTIEGRNESDYDVYSYQVTLNREVIYYNVWDEKNSLCFNEILIEDNTPIGVEQYQNRNHKVKLIVPPAQPTDLISSKIIKIRYFIQVLGTVECNDDPTLEIPITIGTIPFTNNVNIDSLSSTSYGLAALSLNDEIIEPPTYEEATRK